MDADRYHKDHPKKKERKKIKSDEGNSSFLQLTKASSWILILVKYPFANSSYTSHLFLTFLPSHMHTVFVTMVLTFSEKNKLIKKFSNKSRFIKLH